MYTVAKRSLPRNRIVEILEVCRSSQVAVIGDFCLDAYWYADMTKSELSRETPRFPLPIVREVYSPGGAGNVCANLASLGLRGVFGISVFGGDWRGEILRGLLTEMGVSFDFSLNLPGQVTPAYIKPMLQGYSSIQEDSRLDFGPLPLSTEAEDALISKVKACMPLVDAVAIVDQLTPGVITPRLRDVLIQLARSNPEKPFVVDSRRNIGAFTSMIPKPNELEALKASGLDIHAADLDVIEQAGVKLRERAARPVYITLGERGSLLLEESAVYVLPQVPTEPPIDIVGAGDTFLSALCASLAGGALPWEAGMIANLASSVTIRKLNTTGTATPEEILARYDSIAQEWSAEVRGWR